MARQLGTESLDIGENSYRLTRLNFDDSKQVLKSVGDLLGPALGELLDGSGTDALASGKVASGAISGAAASFFRGLDLKSLGRLEDIYAKGTTVGVTDEETGAKEWKKLGGGVKALHFSDYPAEYIPWLVASTKLNLSPFFGGLQDAVKDLQVVKTAEKE